MSGLSDLFRGFVTGAQPLVTVLSRVPAPPTGMPAASAGLPQPCNPSASGITILADPLARPAVPYWVLRGWRHVGAGVYLGYFKTRTGRCHGVIKWRSQRDFGFYVHDVPDAILDGPHGACFTEVEPGKFRVHFSQLPGDLNSGIFYIETLLQEAFRHECLE